MTDPSKESLLEAWRLCPSADDVERHDIARRLDELKAKIRVDPYELQLEIDELKAERDDLRAVYESFGRCLSEYDKTAEQRDRLVAALREYGSHRNDCINFDIVTKCDCGWRALLAEMQPGEK